MKRSARWINSAFGFLCAVVGGVLVLRPFESLSVLMLLVAAGALLMGVVDIVHSRRSTHPWAGVVAGSVWIAAGVYLAVGPVTIRVLAVMVGLLLIARGLFGVFMAVRSPGDERAAGVIGGAASVVFGILALSWPSVTVLVVAILFGLRLVLFGLSLVCQSFRTRHGDVEGTDMPRPRSRLRRSGHLVGTVVALAVGLLLTGVSIKINSAQPAVDGFYATPADVPARPGELLDTDEFTRTIPDDARASRILYTTTRSDGVPAVASALVVTPTAPSDQPRPVIALAHGTTGVDRRCAPSVLDDPFGAGAFFELDRVIDQGWALVATDYVGLGTEGGHPYLVGEPAGRNVLDSVRAAHQLDGADLADETVVWGHSQGGGAALWTGGLAPDYAPDVDVIGVAALAPASDLVGLAESFGEVTGGPLFASFVLDGFANAYDDISVDDYLHSSATEAYDATVSRCLSDPSLVVPAVEGLAVGDQYFSADLASGPLLDRLGENVPTKPIDVPLLIAQGKSDQLIDPTIQDGYVEDRCAAGQQIDYRTFAGRGHVSLVETDSPLIPELFTWTKDRLSGADSTPTCGK